MHNVTTEKAVRNQIASAEMEGLHFDKKSIELIKKYADNQITHDELIKIVSQLCVKRN